MSGHSICTLCFVRQSDQLLLGRKKRGLGQGYWNGFGGHVEPGETIEAAAIRELREESGLVTDSLSRHGLLEFTFANGQPSFEVHVYAVNSFSGQPRETDEMLPRWFPVNDLPYRAMWADDPHWLPLLLAGKHFHGRFHFQDTKVLLSHRVKEIHHETTQH